MIVFTIAFLLGDALIQSQALLPSHSFLLLTAFIAVLIFFSDYRTHYASLLTAGFLVGFAWSGWQASSALSWNLPHEWEGKPLVAHGVIDGLPVTDKFGMHFMFALNTLQNQNLHLYAHTKIRLSWQGSKYIRVGDEYEFTIKLKRLHGMRNPGGFDYEAWALENGMRATGSVLPHDPHRFITHQWLHAPVNQIRQWLQQRILLSLPNSETSPWLLALMIGERSAAPPQHWQILRATGTNHLMAIAGLHIGLISGLIFLLVKYLWRRSHYLTSLYPVPLAASVASLITAWLYSGLAGFSIPTQRACIMVTFILCALLARRRLPAWHAWAAALMVVLLLNPLAVLSESLWLSFGTLALIIYGMSGRLSPKGLWWKWGRVQWVIGFGLLPLSLYFFQQTSIVSVAANSLAIPWLGFLVLPCCLLSTIFLMVWPPAGALFLWIADKNLAALWWILEWFAHLHFAVWTTAIPSYLILLVTIIACLILLLPAGTPGRWLGFAWLLPVILIKPSQPDENDFWMTVLDVGQGLSVVIQTHQHALVFDAGPRFGPQFDMGESVVVPFLYSSGIERVDKMIISHGDNDHLGGAGAVMHSLPVTQVLTSAVDKFTFGHADLCLAGTQWTWDGVKFSLLYPFEASLALGNDSSCVLKIDNGYHSVLLTGDIEKFAEKQLLAQSEKILHADIITAPHHGSKTSSQHRFVQAVMPGYVVYATGYRNRYHFPHQAVEREYSSAGTLAINTVNSGAVQFRLTKDDSYRPDQYRLVHQHYWHD